MLNYQGTKVLAYLALGTLVIAQSDIILLYDFYPADEAPVFCMPKTQWNLSTTFSFHDESPLPNLIVKNESIRHHLRITCISSQPLHWILGVPDRVRATLTNYYLEAEDSKGAPENRYHICITFQDLTSFSGPIRCESILNETLGVEIFIQNEEMKPTLGDCSKDYHYREFVVTGNNDSTVPCKMHGGGTGNKNSLHVRLKINDGPELGSENSDDFQEVVQTLGYDPRMGFRMNESIVPNSKFICENADDPKDCGRFVAFTGMEKIDLRLDYIEGRGRDMGSDKLECSAENLTDEIRLGLHMILCSQLPSCAHQRLVPGVQRPYKAAWTAVRRGETTLSHPNRALGEISAPPRSGLVYCQVISEKGHRYVAKHDYFFKGLDKNGHLVSKSVPIGAVLTLEERKPPAGSNFLHCFLCTSSTFVLFRAFSITLEFGEEKVDFFVHAPPNPRQTLETQFYKLSGADRVKGEPASQIWINVSSPHLTFVSCSAPFTHNMSWASIRRNVTMDMRLISRSHIAAWLVPAILALLSTLAAALYFWKYKKNKALTQGLTAAEIDEFRFGNAATDCGNSDDAAMGGCNDGTECGKNGNTAMPLATLNCDGLLDVNSLGFPQQFQIPSNELEIYKNERLGEGEFAFCYRGKCNGVTVAVKMLKNSVQTEDFKNYLKEVKLMAYIGQHPNIIQFYGAVIEKLDQKIAPIVVELSPYGQLLKFLRERRKNATLGDTLTDNDLTALCAQVASGMEYLHRKNVIHSDLAARNILVFEGLTVKITDFGLSKNLYESSFYSRRHQQVRLPWPWMAPESLELLTFSVHSDVWSFGVTAWEIFTLGQVPFAAHNWTTEFMRLLTHEGLRLPKPARALEEIYDFLLLCWSINPLDRPSFSEIKIFFLRLMPTGSVVFDHNC